MAPRLLTILTGRNLPKIRQSGEAEPSTINDKTIADFARVVDQTGNAAFRAVSAQDSRLLNNGREVRNRPGVDVDGSAYCRIFGRFRPVRMVSKRGAMPHQSVCGSGGQIVR